MTPFSHLIAKRERRAAQHKATAVIQRELVQQVCKALNYGRRRRKKIRFCGL